MSTSFILKKIKKRPLLKFLSILNIEKTRRKTAMLRQRFENAKQNNLKQYIPTTDMLNSVCSFAGSVYGFNDCTEQKYAWNKQRLKC